MNQQTTLDLATEQTTVEPSDRTAFEIGWDHARHGLVPPADLMLDGTPVAQGYFAGKAVFGRRTLAAPRPVRQWLTLRQQAWRTGQSFETTELTPNYIGQLHTTACPVLRQPLGGAAQEPLAATLTRLNPAAGWAAGHLATMSRRAAEMAAAMPVAELVRRARRAEAASRDEDLPLEPAAHWWRLAALRAFATPLPFAEAVRVPLAVLPPNRVRVLNAAQGLQALVTTQFLAPGWSARLQAMAALLPEHTLRQDFNLFISALMPRVLQAEVEARVAGRPGAMAHALEDAWLGERVQRRWQHFAFSLGEAGVDTLLERALAAGLSVRRTLVHEAERATAGWGLDRSAVAPGPWPGVDAVDQGARRRGTRTAFKPPKNRSATTGARLS